MLPAARAFKNICIDHAKIMQPYAIDVIEKILPMDGGSKWTIIREYELILEGFAQLVKNCEDSAACENMMKRII
jgi:hypothetical protein